MLFQANPKLANTKDDDERLPIHWALSYGQTEVVRLLVQRKDFDPDVQACCHSEFLHSSGIFLLCHS
jgi:ankyrin repeat protein